MSEPKLISPLLDGFSLGSAISAHDGVRCYPALRENSDKKYIVKIISIPASQVQLDALLLTGACADPTSAMEYFRELSDGVEKEAACLKNLSRLEGFLAFEGCQTVPMEDRLGYDVYLLSSYRQALEKYVHRNSMTHLEAVNLGIDICNALSAARRAGWIYVDLKPSNIFISDNKEYRIGDLGLMELEGLDLAALPAKYRSAYTAPELLDELNSPNITQDTYALGLILYQIFNNGVLPQVPHPMEDELPAPANADYEIAEILLRACSPDPKKRYEDPADMGHALVAYMLRNGVNDNPIIPPVARLDPLPEAAELSKPRQDETLPGMNDDQELTQENLNPEMTQMMEQADDLIRHDLPAPPVAPEGATVDKLEEEVLKAAEAKKQAQAELQAMLRQLEEDQQEETAGESIPLPVPEKESAPLKQKSSTVVQKADAADRKDNFSDLSHKRRKERRKVWITTTILVLLLSLIGAGGFWFYNNYYIQMIDSLSVTGTENELTVRLDSRVDESLLTIYCTDTYGNTTQQSVQNGQASFTGLLPDMLYRIQVEIEGFHRLNGSTTHEYTTPAETKIVSYTAMTGPEDGSVVLNFTVDGPDSEEWTVICTAEGQETIESTFTGHMATVTGLTVGSSYEMRLIPSSALYITSGDILEFTASSIIIAENLEITTDGNGSLTITWTAPEGAHADSWNVRCYSVDGYDQQLTTDQLTATFDGISSGSAYTVEITAAGMTQPARAGITANPIYLSNIQVADNGVSELRVSWDYAGNAPEEGWLLLYTIDGSSQPQIVQCPTNSGVIEVRVPAATYDFTIQAADGSTVFQNTHSYTTANADIYQNVPQAFYRKVHGHKFFVNMLKTPEVENWTHNNVNNGMYTTTFASGDGVSVLMYFMMDFYIRHEDISVMYVIRDENGTVLADYIAMEHMDWRDDLWNGPNYHYCGLDVPLVPTEPGKYSLGIYFDGLAMTSVEFTITE